MLQELRYADLLTTLLVINLWAGGIALWPQATVDYMLGAAGAPVAAVGVALQVLVPAVQGCRQGRAFDLDVYPGAAEQGHRATEGQMQTILRTHHQKREKSVCSF